VVERSSDIAYRCRRLVGVPLPANTWLAAANSVKLGQIAILLSFA